MVGDLLLTKDGALGRLAVVDSNDICINQSVAIFDLIGDVMSVLKRGNSPYWYIQFQFNGKTYIKSSKTTDKRVAE